MSNLTSRQRQLVYLAAILVLMVPIVVLGMPTGEQEGYLGIIAQKRMDYGLGEPSLGNVDPASATMNLVLLGLRGVATNLLWMEADHQKTTKNFSELNSTVESIILLQPHYQAVWSFQAWNLTYNVSAECDAVADRYYWVKTGLKFLMRGVGRNKDVPELYHNTGDYFGKKIGRSDEHVEFRRFFKYEDPDVEKWKGLPDGDINPDGLDNYLVARTWYEQANEVLNKEGVEQHKMALPLFVTYPHRSQMDYAAALQDEGSYGEITREAWLEAYRGWTEEYGQIEFQTPGGNVRFEANDEEIAKMSEEDGVPYDLKKGWQQRYQNMVNYRYWKLRCLAEGDPLMAAARRAFYEARIQFREEQDLQKARDTLYQGLSDLKTVADKYRDPDGGSRLLKDDVELIEDVIKAIVIWRHILDLLAEPIPDEFPMDEVWNNPEHESLRGDMLQRFLEWQGA